jgi:magnesium transporter
VTALTRAYRDGTVKAENFPLEAVSDHLAEADTFVWIDFCLPSKAEIDQLAEELGLHELAIEDALEEHQRSKLDRYESHLFLACHAVSLDLEAGTLLDTEIDAFVNRRWLVTVRKSDRFDIGRVTRRWDDSPDLAVHGVAFFLYCLLDEVVDDYFDTVQVFDDYYDDVSEGIFSDQPLEPSEQRHWFEIRRALVHFHRKVVPLREAVSSLMRREHAVVPEALYPYYQDVYDHSLRVAEATDSLRDLATTIVETNLSLRDYRQNQTVKKVSSWAAIIAVPAMVTGYYGMNVRFPGLGTRWAWVLASVIVVGSCLVLYRIFKARDWL